MNVRIIVIYVYICIYLENVNRKFFLWNMDCDICGCRSNAKLFQKNACFSCIHFFRNTMRFGRIYKCSQKDSNIKCIIRSCDGCRIRKMFKEGFYS